MLSGIRTISEALLESIGVVSNAVYVGNTAEQYLSACLLFLVAYIAFRFLQLALVSFLAKLALRTPTDLDDTFIKMVRSFKPPFYLFLALWVSIQYLAVTGLLAEILSALLLLWIVYQVVVVVGILVEDIVFRRIVREEDKTRRSAVRLVANVARGAIWVVGILLIVSNFGIDVSALLAGAGIAGVAVAFALQGILGDLFSSFSIYFDQPFKVGDFIIVGDTLGTVAQIGIKSTRIRALSGEEITLSNQELMKARIQNFGRMSERRVAFTFGVLYETSVEKLRQVPALVREAIEGREKVRFDRAHLCRFGESSYDFEVVYYIDGSDYTLFMDTQQEVMLGMIERLGREGVVFAYPTRTVHVATGAIGANLG